MNAELESVHLKPSAKFFAAANRRVDEKVVKQLVERKSKVQIELANEVALFEGARELLEELQGKVKVGFGFDE